jgi:ribosomal-protein-alanine N-acetyltransferase
MTGTLQRTSAPTGRLGLAGDRVHLRYPRGSDWAEWAALRAASRSFLQPWEPTWADDGLEQRFFLERLREVDTARRQGTCHAFFIFRVRDDVLVGGITLSNIRRGIAQAGTIGYWMGAAYARQGYMTAALHCLSRFSFGEVALHRLEAACLPENAASYNLLRGFGFTEEGLARRYLHINGDWRDHVLFGLLGEDYRPAGTDDRTTADSASGNALYGDVSCALP